MALTLIRIAFSALLFVCAFPPLHWRALAWVALVPFLVGIRRARTMAGAVAGAALWGMLAAYGTTDWLPPTLTVYYGQPYWIGLGLFLSAAFLMGALEYMAFAACYRIAARRAAWPMVLLAGAAWALAELGRDRLFTGNPWGLLGYSQMPLAALNEYAPQGWIAERVVQTADVGGVYLVSFVIVVVNAWLAEAWLAWTSPARAPTFRDAGGSRVVAETMAATVVVAAVLAYGQARLSLDMDVGGAATTVGIAQANIDLGSRWDPSLYGRNLEDYVARTRELLAHADVKLVVWPENAMTFFVGDEPLYRRAIATVTEPAGIELLAGAPRKEGEAAPRYFNSAFLLSPSGDIRGVYDKQHLLPFAEYFPLGSAGMLRRNFGRVREFSAGAAAAPLATAAGPAGLLMCNEAMFPHLARRRVAEGAELLVNLSNDSWVASNEFAEHQFALVTMRAIETRRDLVRASTSGPSAFVSPHGRVLSRTAPFTSGTLVGTVRRRTEQTVYARWGDTFALLFAATVGLALMLGRSRS